MVRHTALVADSDTILMSILAEIETFAAMPDAAFDEPDPYVFAMYADGVPYEPAFWNGGPLSVVRRMAFSRAARRLEGRGLVRRVTEKGRNRVRCLVPTAAGLARALALVGDGADRQAVREGLRRTQWGTELANAI